MAVRDHDQAGPVRRWVLPALVAALVLGLLDAVWIGLVAGPLYDAELGGGLADPPVAWAAAVFYVVYVLGTTVLVVRPALDAGSVRIALVRGLALGLTAYATFGFTNLAVLDGWPLAISALDTLWGGVLTATTSVVTVLVCRRRHTS
ncbi:hypothetical protein ASG73_10965 [Janibacter sp. Soil728]|uniref:DUF2177 family protein n=1 Tax=Janibacter sp. Soil728 TaxID=1736393 RepID=UPI0006F37BB8|nr:DUF2177 family protein [Janibacter sp. Soil728]KRE36848.1 hypothetical protein ASG73_10965 [Janibacter sp. Soil728]